MWDGPSINGIGVYKYSNGHTYIGPYKDGKKEGCGIFMFDPSIGGYYLGEFRNNIAYKVGINRTKDEKTFL